MKITFVTSTLTSGGSERVISLLANEFSQKGHKVTIILLCEPIVFYPINPSVEVIYARNYGKNGLSKGRWLRRFIKKSRPDVVIPFMTAVYCFTIFWLLGLSVPIISSERIDPRFSPPMRKFLRFVLLRFTDHLVVQTQEIKSYYAKSIQSKTTIIPNPVSEKVFDNETVVDKETRIISVGRLYSQKNQRMMIDAFSKVAERFPLYKLAIYGEGPLRNELENYIKSKGLEKRIFLPGRTDNIIEELRQSELFCLSSNYEGMSNALLEAVCVGLPIVTTHVSGVDDLIENGINGLIVNVNDSDGFAIALEKLIKDKKLRETFSIKNKEIANRFKLDRIVSDWENTIYKVIKSEYNA